MFVDTAEQFNTGLKPKAAEWRWSNKMVERPWWPQIILTKIKAFRGLYRSFLCHFRGVFSKKPKIFPKKKGDQRIFNNNIAYHEKGAGVIKGELLKALKLFQTQHDI